jgi:hypothetical protein
MTKIVAYDLIHNEILPKSTSFIHQLEAQWAEHLLLTLSDQPEKRIVYGGHDC